MSIIRSGNFECSCGWSVLRLKERPSALQKRIDLHKKFCESNDTEIPSITYVARTLKHGLVIRDEIIAATGEIQSNIYDGHNSAKVNLTIKQKENIKKEHTKQAEKIIQRQLHK